MNPFIFQIQKGSLWGWCALVLCLPLYIIIIGMNFHWIIKDSGVSFFLYTGYFIAGVGLPILILFQGVRIFYF
ncbi:MAG TPA: hypothetical protein DD706_23555 [Nitrospiraceae bacterium]|nr:hypothetical protein [Nitrospiraceae bacterium]